MVRPTRGHRGTGRFRLCAHTPDARRARLPGARRPVQGGRTCAADTRGLGAPPLELGHGFRISSTVKRDPSGCRRPPETLHARFSCVFRSRRRRWLTRLSLARDPGSPQPPTLERAESAPGPASSLSKKLARRAVRPSLRRTRTWRPAARQAESGSRRVSRQSAEASVHACFPPSCLTGGPREAPRAHRF